MRVLFASSEVVPFARAGGLADVSHHLPKALAELGHEVHVITPKYRFAEPRRKELVDSGYVLRIPVSYRTGEARVLRSNIAGRIPVYLIENDELYNREELYETEYGDYEDNAERFIFFSRAIVELAVAMDLNPDIIHCNDWQTALVPVYLRSLYRQVPGLRSTASVLTIHNLGNQGVFDALDMSLTGLGWEYFTPDGLESNGKLNLMKGGIAFADRITTVSHKYAEEILTPELGFGLETVLARKKSNLHAVLNGVDYSQWNPATDPYIPARYSVHDLAPKRICKADLLSTFHLDSDGSHPLVAMISTLVSRKGFDLLEQVFDELIALGVRFVIMGKGEDQYQHFLFEMQERHAGKVGFQVSYDYGMAHRIEAGADLFLMPSRYEPCGLDQLYSLSYGTIPIVHATGGLDETVIQYDPATGEGTGFKFHAYTGEALLDCVRAAIQVYTENPQWSRLIRNAMQQEFSWETAARAYERIYRYALGTV